MPANKVTINVPTRDYFGGDIVRGFVQLDITKPITNNGIRIIFAGFEKTKCARDGELSAKETHLFLCDSKMEFVNKNVGAGETIACGTYYFPFAYSLPPRLPQTYKYNDKNQIGYMLNVNVDIPHAFDIKANLEIKIKGNITDDKEFDAAETPVSSTGKKHIIIKGNMNVKVTIPRANFFCDDHFGFDVEIDNESSKKVSSIKAYLECTTIFAADGQRKTITSSYPKTNYTWCKMGGKSKDKFTLLFHLPDTVDVVSLPAQPIAPRNITASHNLVVIIDIPRYPDLEIRVPLSIMHRKGSARDTDSAYPPSTPAYMYPRDCAVTALEFVECTKDQTSKVANFFCKVGIECVAQLISM